MGQIPSSVSFYYYINQFKWLVVPSVPTDDVEREIAELGTIRGKVFEIDDGRRVEAYLGVPYGRCGSMETRFQKPEPVKPWSDIKDCREFGPRSLQVDMFWDYFLTPVPQDEENCLHTNIFVPQLKDDEKSSEGMPVMVFIHGGGFVIQSSANYGDRNICRNLCQHNVIVCVIQYRLGLLGFMSTGDAQCPGNYGLWDQREAFVWIKKHIHNFGGNPQNVTAFGQSAGAASVDLLSLSPHCQDLFKRIILMGGNADSDWSISSPKRIINASVEIARKVGWTGDKTNTSELLKFLRQTPGDKCKAAILNKSAFDRASKGLDFCPVIDGDFLPAPVSELRRKAPKLSVVIGTTDYEALLFIALGRRSQSNLVSFEKQLRLSIPQTGKQAQELKNEARKLYLENVNKGDRIEIAKSFMRIFSDSLMNNATQRYVREMVNAGHTVYLYNLTHCNPNSFGIFAYRIPFIAATHCHELRYLFGKGLFAKFRPNEDDLSVLHLMTRMFTNFAKKGDPNYNNAETVWHPLSRDNTYMHLEISVNPKFRDDYQGRRADFWTKVERLQEAEQENNSNATHDFT